jgi:hypothetical protein
MMKLLQLGESAEMLLDAFIDEMKKFPGWEMPEGSYVGAGAIPWDGPGVYCYLGTTSIGQPGAPVNTNLQSPKVMFTTVTFYIMVIRRSASFGYYTQSQPPYEGDLNREGIQSMNDVGALIQAAKNIRKNEDIVSNRQAGFTVGPVTPIGPEGGLSANRISVEVSIEG